MTRAITHGGSHGGGYRGPLAVWTLELTHMRLIGHQVDLPDVDEVGCGFEVFGRCVARMYACAFGCVVV